MRAEKIILGDYGIALLGNAMLLGMLFHDADQKIRKRIDVEPEVRRHSRSDGRGLKRALFAADLLDAGIARAVDISYDPVGDGIRNRQQRLGDLMTGESDLASVRFGDFLYPDAVADRYRIKEALAEADKAELETPICKLGPSDLFERLRRLVIEYAILRAGQDLGLSPAEAKLIGLDGLVTRRNLARPPDWRSWNSDAARRVRENSGWMQDMREKVRRHVLLPFQRLHTSNGNPHKLTILGPQVAQLGASFRESGLAEFSSLGDVANHICDSIDLQEETINHLFPDYGAMSTHDDYRADADPFTAFAFFTEQIAWDAVRQGWVICVAEDGIGEDCYSWVPPEAFPILSDSGELSLPQEIGVQKCFELNERALSVLGADRLWFIPVNTTVAVLGDTIPSETDGSQEPQTAREYNKGFTKTDAPFVAEGVELVESGDAKSALNAAKMLVDKYGEIAESDWTPDHTGIRSFTVGGADRRLQRAIRKALKERGS